MVRQVKIELYYCGTCDCEYESEEEAVACEKLPVEHRPQYIEVGQEIISDFWCGECRTGFTVGKIVNVEGPMPADEDFEHRCVQITGRTGVLHVYYAYVRGECVCKRKLLYRKAVPQIKPNKRF